MLDEGIRILEATMRRVQSVQQCSTQHEQGWSRVGGEEDEVMSVQRSKRQQLRERSVQRTE